MNDYTVGCLEAVNYCLAVIDKYFDPKENGPEVDAYAEIEATELKLLGGLAQHFKDQVDNVRQGFRPPEPPTPDTREIVVILTTAMADAAEELLNDHTLGYEDVGDLVAAALRTYKPYVDLISAKRQEPEKDLKGS